MDKSQLYELWLRLFASLDMEEKEMSATVKALPEREDIPLEVQENLIIEHYNRVA